MRILHFVVKVSNRKNTIHFYKNILGMQILRHEEFSEGCKAYCNGPYDGKWSKTMIGYGSEDDHFVIELTYNYGIGEYKIGNDFQAYSRIVNGLWPIVVNTNNVVEILSPDGYKFYVKNKTFDIDPIQEIAISSRNLKRSNDYWSDLLKLSIVDCNETQTTLKCFSSQYLLKLIKLDKLIDHASAYGRIAFACPRDQLPGLQNLMDNKKETVLTRLVSLDTPGKSTVEVIILADPDGHEICFVGEEAFRKLSKVDPGATSLLEEAMETDKSEEWFIKHGGKQIK